MIRDRLSEFFEEFISDNSVLNRGQKESFEVFDEKRYQALLPLNEMINSFLTNNITLSQFKVSSEKQCRTYPYWGFKGMSGQMQLNQYVNNISDPNKGEVLKKVLRVPQSKEDAKERINTLSQYIQKFKETAENRKSIPRVAQLSMLTYFWELQDHKVWSAYYGSSEKILIELGFPLESAMTPGDKYLLYLNAIENIRDLLMSMKVNLGKYPRWFIEHILWYQFNKRALKGVIEKQITTTIVPSDGQTGESFGEWIPPIVEDLEILAGNKESVWSSNNKIKPEKAFETKLRYAFTLLGFEVTELGQGTGREPDGVARSVGVDGGDYAIIYDAKAREKFYSLGTQDREIQEYIYKKISELKKQRINRYYFCIISSDFDEGDAMVAMLREIDKKTRVPVVLLKARDLLLVVEAKLKQIDIDHQNIENLFLETGLLTREKIISELGI